MATASGIDAQVGISAESAFGTYTTPTRFFEFTEESMKFEKERIESKGIRVGRRVLHRWAAGVQRVTGDITQEFAPQGAALLLSHIFGTKNTTGTGPYTHTFTPGPLDNKSLTVQIGRPNIAGTVVPFSYTGCSITDFEFACSVNEYLTLKTSLYGANESTSETLATASYPANFSPFVFTHGSISIASSAYDVTEISISGANNLKTDRHFISATTPAQPRIALESGIREYTGSLSSDFVSTAAYNRFVNGTEAALALTFNAGSSAQLIFTMNVRYDGETPTVSGAEILEQSLPFKAVSGTSDADAITVQLINADAEA